MSHVLKERTYLDASGTNVVPEDSPDAASLLGAEGDEIPDERAKELGLTKADAAPSGDAPETPAAKKPARRAKPRG